MTTSLRIHFEKIVCGAGALGLGIAGFWWWRQLPALDAVRREPAAVALTGVPYARAETPADAAAARTWSPPPAQSAGAGWVYEVFTPPPIYYHEASRIFAVTPPVPPAAHEATFGLELLDVRRELYRLQLVGYVGAPGDYLGAFTSPLTPETLLARAGRQFAGLDLALRGIEVRKVDVSDDPARPVYDVAAFAVLRDERSGAEITLDNRTRKFTDTPLAVVRFGASPKPREVREGDVIEEAGTRYRIERIQLEPPEVVVARQGSEAALSETRLLKPTAATKAGPQPPASRFAPPAAAGVARLPARD